MKGQSIISPNAPRVRSRPGSHEGRRRQGAARDGAIARLRREGVKATRGWTNAKLAHVVEQHTGVPQDGGDWVEYLLRFAMGGESVAGAAEPRGLDLLHRQPYVPDARQRFVWQQVEARRLGGR